MKTKKDKQKEYDANRREDKKSYYQVNKERIKETTKKYRAKNKGRILEYAKKYRDANKEARSILAEKYRASLAGRYSNAKQSARVRNITFDLTLEQHHEIRFNA